MDSPVPQGIARQAFACFLFVFAIAVYAHSQTPAAKNPTASVSGRVTVKGKGAAGVVVNVRQNEGNQDVTYKGVTNEQGNYKITNVPPGNYLVVTMAPAFVPATNSSWGKTLVITKEEAVENLDFSLMRGGVITGKITDADGRAVVEELVSAYLAPQSDDNYQPPPYTRTDDRGIYRIFGLPPGKYRVGAGQGATGSFGGSGRGYKLTFFPGATEFSQASIIEVTEGSEATGVDITLGRPMTRYSARGRIVEAETGQPVPNVNYGLQTRMGASSFSSTISVGNVSNQAGEFKLEGLTPGKYAIFIAPQPNSALRADAVNFEIIDSDVNGLTVKTSKGASVSGVMVLEGTDDKAVQAKLMNITLHAQVSGESWHSGVNHASKVGPDGAFVINGLPCGMVNFSRSYNGRFHIMRLERDGVEYPKGIEIKEDEQVSGVRLVMDYGSGTISGVVKLEGGTPPGASMFVTMVRVGVDPESITLWSERTTRVDARGQFMVEGLVPATYEVSATMLNPATRTAVRSAKQQVVVTDGAATNVTLTINLSSTPDRP